MSMPNVSAERMAHDTAFIREVFEAREQVIVRLKEDGINDAGGLEVVILTALGREIELQAMTDLMSDLGISGQSASDAADRLVAGGYVGVQVNPRAPGRKRIGLTPKGRATLRTVMDITRMQRLADFPWRDDDIVVCSVQKSGTTWLQMICALLIFQTPVLPAPLQELSPWLDWHMNLRDDVVARLEGQQHRRIMKTHRSLGQIPMSPRVTYVVIARHPLDAALSYYHQILVTEPEGHKGRRGPDRQIASPHDALLAWMGAKTLAEDSPSMKGMLEHLCDSWARRNEPNVILLHYEDLCQDLEKQMRGLAARLGITVADAAWPSLLNAATFTQMRAVADQIQPMAHLQDPAKFFRSGRSGEGRQHLSGAEFFRYRELAAQFAPPDLLAWLHREDGPQSPHRVAPIAEQAGPL